MRNEKYKFPLVDIVGDFVIETCFYSKDFTPQIGAPEELGGVASSDIYLLGEWKRAERKRKRNPSKPYDIYGVELEVYKTKKETITGHKKYVELEKRGELEVF